MVISFVDGVPTAIDGRAVTVLEAIAQLNRRAGAQGVGRLDMVEDRLVGIKSREVYEAPGAIALITAHQELEDLTVERDLRRFKFSVEQRWTELVYDGLWFSPAASRRWTPSSTPSQRHVTGDVRLRLHGGPGGADRPTRAAGRCTTSTWPPTTPATPSTRALSKGFVQLWGLPSRIAAQREHAAADGADPTAPTSRPSCGAARFTGGPADALARAVGVDPLRLAAGRPRPGRLRGRTPGRCTRPDC